LENAPLDYYLSMGGNFDSSPFIFCSEFSNLRDYQAKPAVIRAAVKSTSLSVKKFLCKMLSIKQPLQVLN